MSAAEVTKAAGPPDFVSTTGHRFGNRLGSAGGTIDPSWAWFDDPDTYVAYLSGGTVRRVGVITDSPLGST